MNLLGMAANRAGVHRNFSSSSSWGDERPWSRSRVGGQPSRPELINPHRAQPSLSLSAKNNVQSDTDWGPLNRRNSYVFRGPKQRP